MITTFILIHDSLSSLRFMELNRTYSTHKTWWSSWLIQICQSPFSWCKNNCFSNRIFFDQFLYIPLHQYPSRNIISDRSFTSTDSPFFPHILHWIRTRERKDFPLESSLKRWWLEMATIKIRDSCNVVAMMHYTSIFLVRTVLSK